MKERVQNVGVEGGRRLRWMVPWPALLEEGGKGEGRGMLGWYHDSCDSVVFGPEGRD